MANHAALPTDAVGGRGSADAVDPRARQQVWAFRILADHGAAQTGRMASGQGSCAAHLAARNIAHVWSYDFVDAVTHDGRSLRLLVMIDEFTREWLAIRGV